jgi:hypothetical protein
MGAHRHPSSMFHGSTVIFVPRIPWMIVTDASHGLIERIGACGMLSIGTQSNAQDLILT